MPLQQVNTERPTEPFNGFFFLGEAPGEQEDIKGQPLVGPSGQFFNRQLQAHGISRAASWVGNVFTWRPPQNKIETCFVKKAQAKKDHLESPYPPMGSVGFLAPHNEPELERLKAEIEEAQPKIIFAMGGTALWAVTGEDKISDYRGTVMESTLVPGVKVVPTFHPAAILRAYRNQIFFILDLMKAQGELNKPGITYPVREIWTRPALKDVELFMQEHVWNHSPSGPPVSVDVETLDGKEMKEWRDALNIYNPQHLKSVGISPNPNLSLVIPFTEWGRRYFPPREEYEMRVLLARFLEDPDIPKLFHNAAFDISILWHEGFRVRGEIHDTMIMWHARQPELPKKLAVLGSIFTNEPAWKNMVSFNEAKQNA